MQVSRWVFFSALAAAALMLSSAARNVRAEVPGQVIDLVESDFHGDASFRRVTVKRTDSRYGMIRVVERRRLNVATGGSDVVQRSESLAERLIVKLKTPLTSAVAANLRAASGALPIEVKPYALGPDYAFVHFDGSRAEAMDELVSRLKALSQVEFVEPDYLVRK